MALMSAHGARVRTPLLVSVCVADLLVCACSGPLAVMRASELGGPANSTPIAPFFTGEERPCDTLPCMVLIATEVTQNLCHFKTTFIKFDSICSLALCITHIMPQKFTQTDF